MTGRSCGSFSVSPKPFVVDVGLTDLPESGFYTDDTMYTARGPSWSTRNVSHTFFGRSKNWLQQHVKEGHLILDGETMLLPRTLSSDRARWRLVDIEKAAHALTQGMYIDTNQLLRVITMVRLIAETWGFLDSEGGSLLELQGDVRSLYPVIREWANSHGHRVGRRGKIPVPIVAAYLRAEKR